jgi:DNA-directed RNA polymerase subunit H (RpoH/RPB5)
MHVLQSKHEKLTEEEVSKLLGRLNIALVQLPKISKKDPSLTETFETGDVIKISRKDEEYFRVVV